MGHRKTARVLAKIKLRIFGMDSKGNRFNTEVETVDVSWSGARLTGVNLFARPGETIGAQLGDKKARFLVVWVGTGDRQGQVGLQSLDPKQCIWQPLLPRELYADDYQPGGKDKEPARRMKAAQTGDGMLSYLEYSNERRVHKRLNVTASIKIQAAGLAEAQWGSCKDFSIRGCYAEVPSPLPVHCRVDVTFRVNGRHLFASGIVRNVNGRGMGIEFLQMSKEDQQVLQEASQNKKSDLKLW
jgi:PilZ domain